MRVDAQLSLTIPINTTDPLVQFSLQRVDAGGTGYGGDTDQIIGMAAFASTATIPLAVVVLASGVMQAAAGDYLTLSVPGALASYRLSIQITQV